MLYIEKEREIEIDDRYDVIVVGSGPAGVSAAISAGRCGVKVLLLEMLGSVGGISTSGLMSHWTGTCGNKLFHEYMDRMVKKTLPPSEWSLPDDPIPYGKVIDPELLRNVYYEMLREAGVDVILYTIVADVIMKDNKVIGVIGQSKSGRVAYLAKVIIDASGDGDVAYHAGAAYTLGRESDHKMQPATLMFKVAGVDMSRAVFPPSFETTVDTPKGELQALAREKLPKPAGHVLLYKTHFPGIVTCNMTNVTDIDGTRVEDLTRAELVCRSQMEPIIDFLRAYVPGYEHCYIISAASQIGIRETRHFHGVYTICEEEIYEAKQFPDAVVFGAWFNFDIHNIEGAGLDAHGSQKHFEQQNGYTIPYGCMVPERIDGLLLSGRNISGTHVAHSNFRAMPICSGIGEADGIAAALAVKDGIEVRDVSPSAIQKRL